MGYDVLKSGERRLTKSHFGLLALNLCLFLLFTYWLIEHIDFRVLLNQFSRIPIWATLGATVIYLGALLMYGLRMALILDCSVALSWFRNDSVSKRHFIGNISADWVSTG